MNVETLIKKFQDYEYGLNDGLTIDEVQFLCENEDHMAFMFDISLYRDIMELRDHLELEG